MDIFIQLWAHGDELRAHGDAGAHDDEVKDFHKTVSGLNWRSFGHPP